MFVGTLALTTARFSSFQLKGLGHLRPPWGGAWLQPHSPTNGTLADARSNSD